MQYFSKSPQDTLKFGNKLAKLLKAGDILCLFGELGSGKTTLTKGIAAGLGVKQDIVNSPSFTLLQQYKGRMPIYHFDLYRLDCTKEILNLGYEEFLYGQGVAVVEWADKLGMLLPKDYVGLKLLYEKSGARTIEIQAHGRRAQEILVKLKI